MDRLIQEPYSGTDKLADDALEELNSLGLGHGAHTVIGMALGKLKAYEGTGLTPEQIKAQMQNLKTAYSVMYDYEKKISDGLLLRLPCKVWDKVYIVDDVEKEIEESQVYGIDIDGDGITIMIADYYIGASSSTGYAVDEFGDSVFLTREEAEKALAEMEE